MSRADEFLLDPSWTFLNHGSFGATPRAVLAEQDRWRTRLEQQPVRFMLRELEPALRTAQARAAAFIGAQTDNVVFVRNATAGVNAALGSLALGPGDRVLTTDHRYEAVGHTLSHTCARVGAALDVVPIPFPLPSAEIVLDRIAAAITPQTRLIVVDHISSMTALVFPVRRLAALARARGCMLLVDGAHAPGHLDLNIGTLGADFWVGNLHKWPCAPKGAAVLWADPAHHGTLHPTVISNFYGQGFHQEFAWCGTDDPTPWLASVAAMDLHDAWGGATLRAAHQTLAAQARTHLCDRLDLEPGTGEDELSCALAAMLLPASAEQAPELYAGLLEQRIECFVLPWREHALLRISAFSAYNHIEQYHRLGEALAAML